MGAQAAAADACEDGASIVHNKLEYINAREARLAVAVPKISVLVALALLIWESVAEFQQPNDYLLTSGTLQYVTVPFAALCVLAVLLTAALLASRLLWAHRKGLRWDPAHPGNRQAVIVAGVALLVQGVNASFWLVSLAYTWAGLAQQECRWNDILVYVSAFIQFTCWNIHFLLNTLLAATILPTGAWEAVFETAGLRMHAWKGRLCGGRGTAQLGDDGAAAGSDSTVSDIAGQDTQPAAPPPRLAALYRALSMGARGGTALADALAVPLEPARCGLKTAAGPVTGVTGKAAERAKAAGVMTTILLLVNLPLQVFICIVVGMSLHHKPKLAESANGTPPAVPCTELEWECTTSFAWVSALIGFWFMISAATFLGLIYLAYWQLQARPYNDYRLNNLKLRLGLKFAVPTYLVCILTLVLQWFIDPSSCNSMALMQWGIGPAHIVFTAQTVLGALLFMPQAPDPEALTLHDTLQAFAWTEEQQVGLVAGRGHPEEPCFCLETALKALYASLHAYRHFFAEGTNTVTSLASLQQLYGLRHHEWLHEPTHDSNCLLAWGQDCLVVAFRGTASMANIKADSKLYRSAHPPVRGSLLLGTRPLVHAGFLASWTTGEYNTQVLHRIRQILEAQAHAGMEAQPSTADRCCIGGRTFWKPAPPGTGPPADAAASEASSGVAAAQRRQGVPFRILVTGHSLGGAMSTLCSIDLAKALPQWGFRLAPSALPAPAADHPLISLSCYTFGAPRTGNTAFAQDFNRHVPDCWAVINGQDAVAHAGKFFFLFKRPGKPVLLSRSGDLIVRPSAIEHTAHRTSGSSVTAHFLLKSYGPSLAAVLECQLGSKPLPGGREALEALWLDPGMSQALERLLGMRQADEEAGSGGQGAPPLDSKAGQQQQQQQQALAEDAASKDEESGNGVTPS